MGYGEFGGGGSVKWKVQHGGDSKQHSDTDPKPSANDRGQFLLVIKAGSSEAQARGRTTFEADGTVRISFDIVQDDRQIRISW